MTQEEYVTATQARDILGVSQNKIATMLGDGTLKWIPDPFNKKAKLIKRADLQALLDSAPRPPRRRQKQQPSAAEIDRAAA